MHGKKIEWITIKQYVGPGCTALSLKIKYLHEQENLFFLLFCYTVDRPQQI